MFKMSEMITFLKPDFSFIFNQSEKGMLKRDPIRSEWCFAALMQVKTPSVIISGEEPGYSPERVSDPTSKRDLISDFFNNLNSTGLWK